MLSFWFHFIMSIPGLRIRMTEMVEPELPVQLSKMHQLVEVAAITIFDFSGMHANSMDLLIGSH